MMRLKVTKVEAPDPPNKSSLPIVHFDGRSRSMDASWDPNANSKIRGTVRLTPDGEVRWTTVSIFSGYVHVHCSAFGNVTDVAISEERWCSEGIQPGGPRSARGVVGTWFDKDHDPHGPAGPTAFWKVAQIPGVDDESDEEDAPWLH